LPSADFENESDEMRRQGVDLTPELWMVKLLLGAVDSSYDRKDEQNAPAQPQPGFGAPPQQPGYGGAPQGYGAPPQGYGAPPQPQSGYAVPPQPQYGRPPQPGQPQPPTGYPPQGGPQGYGSGPQPPRY